MSRRSRRSALRTFTATFLALAILAGAGMAAAWAISRGGVSLSTMDLEVELMGRRIPRAAFDAYLSAAARSNEIAEDCRVDWPILAGLGRIESRHGEIDGSWIGPDGAVEPPIRGPRLDGRGAFRAITDTDGGRLDGDADWDRAMGPFQFIPTTWRELGRDATGSGVADPDNIHDAALTAVAHLCLRQPGDYADRVQLRRALLGYNASGRYADDVLRWIEFYRTRDVAALISG